MIFDDLTGRQFGSWYVIERAENRSDGTAAYRCQCKCDKGTIRKITGSALRHNRTTKCAWCAGRKGWFMSSRKVAKDQRYGWLTTKKFVGGGKGGGKGPKWECVCHCGRTLLVGGYHLVSGHSTKCRSCSVRVRHVASGYHSLTDVDRQKMTATCNKCGAVPVTLNRGVAKCYVASVHGRVQHLNEA